MTYEETLQSVLRYCVEACGKIDTCRGEDKECAEATVIKALKKQISKKVRYQNRHGEGFDLLHEDYYHCPSCGRRLRNKQHDPYCGRCGQALDWEVLNDE